MAVPWSAILGDILYFGELAASIFVKNPEHAAQAGKIIQVVNQAVPVIQGQIASAQATVPNTTAPVEAIKP